MPALLALSASSPFWMGLDTGYASYRTLVWGRLPVAGIPDPYRSLDEYRPVVQLLVDTGTIQDTGQIYWDVRVGNGYDTVEFRTADMCTTIDETLVQAGLSRALAGTCLDEVVSGQPLHEVPRDLLRAARWRAARSGLDDILIDVLAGESVPAAVLIDRLLTYLRPALEEAGDWGEVAALVDQTQHRGTSARRQRRAFARGQRLKDVVDVLARATASGSVGLEGLVATDHRATKGGAHPPLYRRA